MEDLYHPSILFLRLSLVCFHPKMLQISPGDLPSEKTNNICDQLMILLHVVCGTLPIARINAVCTPINIVLPHMYCAECSCTKSHVASWILFPRVFSLILGRRRRRCRLLRGRNRCRCRCNSRCHYIRCLGRCRSRRTLPPPPPEEEAPPAPPGASRGLQLKKYM